MTLMMTCSPKFMGDGAALAGFELGPGHDGDEVIIVKITVLTPLSSKSPLPCHQKDVFIPIHNPHHLATMVMIVMTIKTAL